MKKALKKLMITSLLSCCSFLLTEPAMAGAWIQPEGDGLFIGRVSWYSSSAFYDVNWDKHGAPHHRELQINPYTEYGLTDKVTIGENIFFLDIDNQNGPDATGVGDIELFARYLLWGSEWSALSVQGLVKFPGNVSGFAQPNKGARQTDAQATIFFGTGGRLSSTENSFWFLDTNFGFRERFQGPANELRLEWVAGLKVMDQKLWWMLRNDYIFGLGNHNAIGPNSPFDLYTIEPSVLYFVQKNIGVQGGVRYDYLARNVGVGVAPFAAVWVFFN